MVVTVDTRSSQEYQNFIYNTFKRITAQHPQLTFIFIITKALGSHFVFSENIITEVVKQSPIQWFLKLKINSLLKKYKADVFVTAKAFKTNVPQCLIAFDNITPASLKNAQTIVATSAFSKKKIIDNYKIDKKKSDNYRIDVVYIGADEIFKPIALADKEKIKVQYADGCEYFLCSVKGIPGNLLILLKAFSLFKKMQKSNMQLVCAFDTRRNKEFLKDLHLYKFKNEIKVLENISSEEEAVLTAGAYAYVHPYINQGYAPALQALKCNVPVIAGTHEEIIEICGDAALYFDEKDHKDIADKMMLIYKNENIKQQLIEKGKAKAEKYNWDTAANQLWQSIRKAVN